MNQSIAMERIANSVSMVPVKAYALDPQDPDFVDFLPNTDPFEVEHENPVYMGSVEEWEEGRAQICETLVEIMEEGHLPHLTIPAHQFTAFGVKKFLDMMLRFNIGIGPIFVEYCTCADCRNAAEEQEVTRG